MRKHYDIPETWHIFPLANNAKIPEKGSAGFKDALPRDEALKEWPDINNGNVGLYPGPSDLLVVDVDVKHGAIGDATMKKLQKEHGKLPETFTVKTPSGGWHLYFKKPDIEHIGNNSIGEDIDIRCDGGYVLAPGSSIDGNPYTIIKNKPVAALPDAWVPLFKPEPKQSRKQANRSHTIACKPPSEGYPPTSKADVEEALKYVTPDLPYDEWVKVLAALHDGGFDDLAHSWSAGSTRYDPAEVDAKLASFTSSGVTIATVFHYAQEGGYQPKVGKTNLPQSDKTPWPEATDIIRLSDVKPEPIRWLWQGRIALGKLSMIAGDPGLGKSLLTVELAAHVSKGKPWPVDNSDCPRGEVLLLSAEDDLADTIRPRMDAAGGDASRVYVLPMVTTINSDGKESKRVPSLVDDVERIGAMIKAHPDIRLLTIDPISAYLAGVDSHKNTDMRAVLSPWADLASRYRVAIVCISHLNKGQGSAMYRTAGSIAFMAAARAAFSVSKDKDDELRRLVLPVKNNLGPDEGGLAYRVGTENGVPRIEWEPEAVHITAEDALSPDHGEHSERQDAAQWLREILKDDSLASKTVEKMTRDAGYKWRTVQRAGKECSDIEIKRVGFGKGSRVMWTYIHATETHTRQHINVARMDEVGAYGEKLPADNGAFDDPETWQATV